MYKRLFLALVAFAVASFASSVVEDTRSRFVLNDEVIDDAVHPCVNDLGEVVEGFTFVPEDASYESGNAVPSRIYHIAVPGNEKPSVSVADKQVVPLNRPFCKGAGLKFGGTSVSAPYQRDGLWIVDVAVPLFVKHGGSFALRKSFRLDVGFPAAGTGGNPGARAVSRVRNPKGAARFGVAQSPRRKALRRAAASEIADVHFLAQVLVGDKNISTVAEDGLYAVSYADFRIAMQEQGRQDDLHGIRVDRLRMYGASPDTLAAQVPGADLRAPTHLFEIPIEVRDHGGSSGKGNGIFDEGDTIVFVGYGTSFWKRCDREDPAFENGKMDYFYSVSPYSYYQHFALGWSESGTGKRLDAGAAAPSGSGKNIDWLRYVRAEKDVFLRDTYYGKPLEYESTTGKEWFWVWHHRLDTTVVDEMILDMPQTNSLESMVDGGKQYVAVSFFPHRAVWASVVDGRKSPDGLSDQVPSLELSGKPLIERTENVNFTFKVNGQKFERRSTALLPTGGFRIDNPGLKKSGNRFELTMLPNDFQYDRFDGYSLAYQWTPVVDSSEWLLPGKVSGIINIPVGSASDTRVMKFVNLEPVGLLKIANGVAKDSVSAEDDVRYLAYRSRSLKKPAKVVGIAAKPSGMLGNIAKINSETEYLIITPDIFAAQSVSLGNFRASDSTVFPVRTTVVAASDIYRHYTGGSASPVAIRNYISYAYSVCPSLKFVLLVGTGHYDYKNVVVSATNYMPPYEVEDAVVEDFFAVLDSGENVRFGNYDLDVAMGRLPVNTPSEFSAYIGKVRDYEQVGKYDHGSWRSNMLLSADDAMNGTTKDNTGHTTFAEEIATTLDKLSTTLNFRWNIKKIYLIDYTYDAAGQKKEASNDLLNLLNQGILMTSYYGHGSKTDWASEGLLKVGYIPRLNNRGRYTILNSFSCTVARFDDGIGRSLSEEFLVAPRAGSIASVGATRETLGPHNRTLGKTLLSNALSESGITYGEAFQKLKNNVVRYYSQERYNNERYVYIGEPVIKMPIAKNTVTLDNPIDSLKALDKMKISGTVSNMNNGTISVSLREGRVNKKLGLSIFRASGVEDSVGVVYEGALLYSEDIPVVGGRFETEFVTPRKLNFGDTAAEFSAWAYSAKDRNIARLLKSNIMISGMSSYADSLQDSVPPIIKIQSCYSGGQATSFAEGQHVKLQSPACLQVVIEDSTALDFREQADEGISFEVTGVEDPYHPYPYIEQSSRRVVLRKTFTSEAYPEGEYEFRVQAMDVLGNTGTRRVYVEITGELKDGLADVFNVPNPMGKKGTTFYFKNLAVDRDSRVDIFIYNQNGRLVKVIKNAVSGVTHWDGRDNHGRKLANGLYHYVVRNNVAAAGDFKKSTWTKKQKLLISR